MKKTLFLMTHVGSGWEHLSRLLCTSPFIDEFIVPNWSCHHPDDLQTLWRHPHKKNDTQGVWLTPILENHQFTYRELCKFDGCRFVYLLARPQDALPEIIRSQGYAPEKAADYYCFRLEGLFQYWRRSGGPWLQGHDVDVSLLEDYLEQKFAQPTIPTWNFVPILDEIIERCEIQYDLMNRRQKECVAASLSEKKM